MPPEQPDARSREAPPPRPADRRLAGSARPQDHFYRHREATLDLGFVREWARELCADRGRPASDPVILFTLPLVMVFEGIRSERQLIETAQLNLAHRWYLGYALDEDLPDHSSLTRIRQRLGFDIFQRFFVDGGKRRLVLAALVTPADVMENVPMRDLLWRVCFRRKLRPQQVIGDTTYGTTENWGLRCWVCWDCGALW